MTEQSIAAGFGGKRLFAPWLIDHEIVNVGLKNTSLSGECKSSKSMSPNGIAGVLSRPIRLILDSQIGREASTVFHVVLVVALQAFQALRGDFGDDAAGGAEDQ